MWRLLGISGQTTVAGWMHQVWPAALVQQPQLPAQVCRSSSAAAAAALQQLAQHQGISSLSGQHHHCTIRSHSSSSSSSTPTHEEEGSQQHQHEAEQPVVQPSLTAPTSHLASKPPAAAAGRSRQLANVAEQSGFVTLPPHATPTGYPESFVAGSSSGRGSGSGTQSTVPIEQVQLPQERLRIQLRQEVQAEEDAQGEGVDAYSLSRSLVSDAHSFDTAAAAAIAADKAPQQQQQEQAEMTLSAEDRELLEKLVGIMTKEGKKSRARRLLLDAMHIIKQQVAKGQAAAP